MSVNIKEPSIRRFFDIELVEDDGIEPTTPCLQSRCSPSWANPPLFRHKTPHCNTTNASHTQACLTLSRLHHPPCIDRFLQFNFLQTNHSPNKPRTPPLTSSLGFTPTSSVLIHSHLVGLVGLEPTTPALSRRCSNQLSYRPIGVNLTN